ncbi:MAG: monovalent cation/H+ antiporter complex subunit F [Candidatus Diapherotrites archaeon]
MIFFPAIVAAIVLLILVCIARIAKGPTVPDRMVGADAASALTISVLVVLGAMYRQSIFVDVAIVYAILSFVGTLFFARYLEAKEAKK